MSDFYSFGVGTGTKNARGEWLEVYFPLPLINLDKKLSETITKILKPKDEDIEPSAKQLAMLATEINSTNYPSFNRILRSLQESQQDIIAVLLKNDVAPKSVPQAYLKLHLLSHRLVRPHQTNLNGIFGVLKNIAWTNKGAIDNEELSNHILNSKCSGSPIVIHSIDKFPKMVDYVVPAGVRIADTSRVRLGAYVGEGTTVMHEGFINFNAGTEGPNMIEGRISAGVFCASGTDIGGGASIMGTLSGGGEQVISIGKNCLLGANSGTGISLGNNCIIEAGLYLTAGTIVSVSDSKNGNQKTMKAKELNGSNDLLFRRNSVSGNVECLPNINKVELNEMLHNTN